MRETQVTAPHASRTRGLIASAVAVAIGATGLVALATSASAVPSPKYFVCKYVGTPGEDETLKEGKNPISASIPDGAAVGDYFVDGQGRSYVLALDDTEPGPTGDPSVEECPLPEGPPVEEEPPVEETPPLQEAPPVVTQTLAETGFGLELLALAGSLSLVGGGLLNGRRVLRARS